MTRRAPSIDGRGVRGIVPGALVLLLGAAAVSSRGPVADSSEPNADPSERVFSTARLVEVSVEMDPDVFNRAPIRRGLPA